MQDNVRRNAAGSWLLLQIVERVVLVAAFAMLVIGFAAGLLVGGISPIGDLIQAYPWWSSLGALCVAGLAYRKVVLNLSRTESRWGRGHAAERRVGDHIEQALVRPGCALAHEVKEALGGAGDIDHIVLTPAGVWVVETKASWPKGRLKGALRQTAANVEQVRRKLDEPDVLIRGALVIADSQELYKEDRVVGGEPVTVFRVVSFWQCLIEECSGGPSIELNHKAEDLARKVWDLGSTRHLNA